MKFFRNLTYATAALILAAGFTGCSDDKLDTNPYNKSGVNILAMGPMPVTRGAEMRLTGTNLGSVKEVLFAEGNQKLKPSTTYIAAEFTRGGNTELTVTIPDQSVPGKLRLVTNSGDTIVSSTNVTFAEKIKVDSYAPKAIHPGQVLTIKGEYVWNIAEIVFTDYVVVPAEKFVKNTRNEIQVTVPMEARVGDVYYTDGAEGSESVVIGSLDVDFPKATSINKSLFEFGDEVIIGGENLDLVTKLDFPGVENVAFTIANDGKTIKTKVPEASLCGDIIMTSAADMATRVSMAVPLAEYAAGSITPATDVKVGNTIKLNGLNLNRIVSITLPAIDQPLTKGQFTQTDTEISFVVPEGMGDGKIKLTQHANHTIETDKVAMYSDAPEMTIWSGKFEIGNWNAGLQDLAWGGYDWSTVKAGQVLTVYLTPTVSEGWAQIRFGNGSWEALPGTSDVYELQMTDTKASITLTDAMLEKLVSTGLVICGANFTVSKITLSILETSIWSGSFALGNWEAGLQDLAWGGYDWSTVKAGTTLKLYYEVDAAIGYINIRFGNGSWVALPSTLSWGNDGNASPDPSETSIKTVLTDADLEQLNNAGGLVICGGGIICKKVVLQ